ncbi:MAG: hypothetical protein D3926_06295 [Desulfobacteraceae bacterium]|nr:MAG: hypothetical protein D3926_06295 [Desulfobacteraceae bacterium]
MTQVHRSYTEKGSIRPASRKCSWLPVSPKDLTPADLDTAQADQFIVTPWHGALIKMKIDQSVAPLKLHK